MNPGKEIQLDIRQTAVVKIGLSRGIEYANDYILDLLGYELTEFVTQKPRIICHPDMPEIIHDMIGDLIMNFREGIAVLKHATKHGDYIWAFTHFKPVYKPDGSFDAFLTRRKPLPTKKVNGHPENMKAEISKLYTTLKEIELHTGMEQARKYLDGFLEYKQYDTLTDYYMSFFDFNKKELEEYFSIDYSTPAKVIRKYLDTYPE